MTKKTSNNTQSLKIPKLIVLSCKLIAYISTKLVTLYVAKLFTTPVKHTIPKRELAMDSNSTKFLIHISKINTKVVLYQFGESDKKILLVHGWSGRGTQLFKIADELLKAGYSTVSFDAPAHGKSPGKLAIMTDFIETILEIDKNFGPFEAAVGHSLGGMTLLNSVKNGLAINHLAIIGSGDIVTDILNDFVTKLELKPIISTKLQLHFEKKYGVQMDSYSGYKSAMEISIPVLVVHDKNDPEVPVSAGINIHKHLKNGELYLTEGLGHRKILGNHLVIEKVISFFKANN